MAAVSSLQASSVGSMVLLLILAGAIDAVGAPTIVTNFGIPSNSACDVAVNPSLNKIYVSGGAQGGQNVMVIDESTFVQTTVGPGSGVFSVDTVNNQYWAGTVYGGRAIVRDGITNAQVTTIGLGFCPHEADVDSAHRRVWVGAQCGGGNDPVWAIDADTFAIVAGPIGTGGILGRIVVNPATGRLYAHTSGGPKRVDPTTFAVTPTAFGQVIGANPVTNRVYAIPAGSSTLQIIDGAPDPEVILTSVSMPAKIEGYRIGVHTTLNRIYMGAPGSTLYVLDGTSGSELGSLPLGTGVSIGAGAVDSTNGRIYLVVGTPVGIQLFVLEDVPEAVDTTPPVITAGTPTGTEGLDGWWVSDVTVPFSATDDLSGFAPDGRLSTDLASKTTVGEGSNLYVTSDGISDMAGNTAAGIQAGLFKVDKTPPEVTVTLPGTGAYPLNQKGLNAAWSATDILSGVVPPDTGTIAIDTGSVGERSLTVPAGTAVDLAGNASIAATATYHVHYIFKGLLPPYQAPPRAFKINSSIPLKWQYTDVSGDPVDSSLAHPVVDIREVNTGTTDGDPITVNDPGGSGLHYDSDTMTWQFNWQTNGQMAGIFSIRIESGETGQIDGPFPIQLK